PTYAPDPPLRAAGPPSASEQPGSARAGVVPAEAGGGGCACGAKGAGAGPSLVYALRQLGYDFRTEARRDSFAPPRAVPASGPPHRSAAHDPTLLLNHLRDNAWDAAAIEWTLNLDDTPVYAIRPAGPFAAEVYGHLHHFLREQHTEGVEWVSVP